MNSVLVTIAPAIDAFTSVYCPACSAASAMISSVRFPSVALSSPPTASPVLAATDSVAWLSIAASGTIASTDSTNSSVCASCRIFWATNTTGTKTSSQSNLLCRTSSSSCFMDLDSNTTQLMECSRAGRGITNYALRLDIFLALQRDDRVQRVVLIDRQGQGDLGRRLGEGRLRIAR